MTKTILLDERLIIGKSKGFDAGNGGVGHGKGSPIVTGEVKPEASKR